MITNNLFLSLESSLSFNAFRIIALSIEKGRQIRASELCSCCALPEGKKVIEAPINNTRILWRKMTQHFLLSFFFFLYLLIHLLFFVIFSFFLYFFFVHFFLHPLRFYFTLICQSLIYYHYFYFASGNIFDVGWEIRRIFKFEEIDVKYASPVKYKKSKQMQVFWN